MMISNASGPRCSLQNKGGPVRYSSETTLLGLPLVSIAFGPSPDYSENRGLARGIVAIGDVAVGVVSFGRLAFGLLSVGGVSVGVASAGGLALGVLSLGGAAVGLVAIGG